MKNYTSLDDLDSSIANHQTVFFVPNYLDSISNKYVDFNFNHLGSNKFQPIPYWKLLKDSTNLKPGILTGFNKRDLYRPPGGK